MEFNVSSAELLKSILDVSKAIPSKTALPILENFLFSVKGDSLEITASDNELTLRTVVQLDNVKEEGSAAVPARHLIELLKTLPDQPIGLKSVGEGPFECTWSNGNSSLPTFPAADYPEIKGAGEDAQKVVFPAQTLVDAIGGTIYATADDEMRPAMNGIFFDMDPAGTTLVASDSHKLICYTADGVQVDAKASFILHKKAAAVLRSIVDKDADDVEIVFDQSTVVFTFGSTMMVCRLVVGKYPKYRDVIPQNNSNVLKIDREQLLGTIRRVSVCANKASNHIKFDLKEGQLEITAQDLGFALAAYEKIACDYSGVPLSIGFKSSFLVEILSNMGCETLLTPGSAPRMAALVVRSNERADTEKVCGIIMPIMVS